MSRLISVHCVKDVSEGLSLTEVEENDCNDTPVCDDNAHKVVCEHSVPFSEGYGYKPY